MSVSLQAEGQEVASVVSAQEIRVVAELLQVSPEGLQKSVTFKLTVSRTHAHRYVIAELAVVSFSSLSGVF